MSSLVMNMTHLGLDHLDILIGLLGSPQKVSMIVLTSPSSSELSETTQINSIRPYFNFFYCDFQ